jgi:hypothetical protein
MESRGMEKQYRIFFQNLRKVWRDPSISRGAKVVLFDLILYAGVDNIAFPSQATIANDLSYKDPRQVGNLIKELKEKNLIDWERGGFGISNKYSLSEEIYFLTDIPSTRKSASYNKGNPFPSSIGNPFPSNVVSESNHRTKSDKLGEKSSYKGKVNPHTFVPSNNSESEALRAWEAIEPNQPESFDFYLWAIKQGLPDSLFGEIASDILHDPKVEIKGAVFVSKVKKWIYEHKGIWKKI